MTAFISTPEDSESFQRLVAFAADLPGAVDDTGKRGLKNLGDRIKRVLIYHYKWTQYIAKRYDDACADVLDYYTKRLARLNRVGWINREQAFELGMPIVERSTANMLEMARLAHAHKGNKEAMDGFTDAFWYKAEYMANAVEWWPEWFDKDSPRASSVYECLILFKLGSLKKKLAGVAYNYWRDHQTLSYREMESYIDTLKANKPTKNTNQFQEIKGEAVAKLEKLNKHAENGKQAEIDDIIERVEKL